MKKITKLRICDRSLLFLTVVILASGLQLEFTHSSQTAWVWIHIVLGLTFAAGIIWHLALHPAALKAPRPGRRKGQGGGLNHPVLSILFFLMLLSGIVAACHWTAAFTHSPIGGVHGKIGFVFIIAVMVHIFRKRFFFLKPTPKPGAKTAPKPGAKAAPAPASSKNSGKS